MNHSKLLIRILDKSQVRALVSALMLICTSYPVLYPSVMGVGGVEDRKNGTGPLSLLTLSQKHNLNFSSHHLAHLPNMAPSLVDSALMACILGPPALGPQCRH